MWARPAVSVGAAAIGRGGASGGRLARSALSTALVIRCEIRAGKRGTVAEKKRWTVRDLRRDNRTVLLWSLFSSQPCSRQDLSEATGLSTASVSNVIRELISDGIVTEAGSVDSDGGRPRALLRMDPGYGRVIGVDVGETRVRVELFDLAMTVRAKA